MEKLTEEEIIEALKEDGKTKFPLSPLDKDEVVRRLKRAGIVKLKWYRVVLCGVGKDFEYTYLDQWGNVKQTDDIEWVSKLSETDVSKLPEWAQGLAKEV